MDNSIIIVLDTIDDNLIIALQDVLLQRVSPRLTNQNIMDLITDKENTCNNAITVLNNELIECNKLKDYYNLICMTIDDNKSPYVEEARKAIHNYEKSLFIYNSLSPNDDEYLPQKNLVQSTKIIRDVLFEILCEVSKGNIPSKRSLSIIQLANVSSYLARLAFIESSNEIINELKLAELNTYTHLQLSQIKFITLNQ